MHIHSFAFPSIPVLIPTQISSRKILRTVLLSLPKQSHYSFSSPHSLSCPFVFLCFLFCLPFCCPFVCICMRVCACLMRVFCFFSFVTFCSTDKEGKERTYLHLPIPPKSVAFDDSIFFSYTYILLSIRCLFFIDF